MSFTLWVTWVFLLVLPVAGSVLEEVEVALAFTPLGVVPAEISPRGEAGWGTKDGAEAEKDICFSSFAAKSAGGSDDGWDAGEGGDVGDPLLGVGSGGGWSVE